MSPTQEATPDKAFKEIAPATDAVTDNSTSIDCPREPLENDRLPLLKRPETLEARLREIPPEPGCYFMRDRDDIPYTNKAYSSACPKETELE